MADILNIGGEPIFDDRIKFEFHTYNTYINTTFGHSDEIRIPIQQQVLYTLPCESILYVEGRLTSKEKNVQKQPNLRYNCVAFMFDKIRYEFNATEIDRDRNVGITSNEIAYSSNDTAKKNLMTDDGYFNFCIPLSMLLGFCKDYRRVVINARYELILIRAHKHLHIQSRRMPHVALKLINYLCCAAIKTATQLKKPRYVIFGLQNDKKKYHDSKTYFDTDLNLDFDKRRAAILYYMICIYVSIYLTIKSLVKEINHHSNGVSEEVLKSLWLQRLSQVQAILLASTKPKKVQAIVEFQEPAIVKGLRRFLGMLNFYNRFLKDLASMQAPLLNAISGRKQCNNNAKIEWTPELKQSFQRVKEFTTLKVPGEFFSSEEMPSDPRIFVEDFCVIMQKLRPRPTSHYIRLKLFFHKDLYNCSHVFFKAADVPWTNRTPDRIKY
ncbi:POL5 protein, partial [Pseudoatta argentina]